MAKVRRTAAVAVLLGAAIAAGTSSASSEARLGHVLIFAGPESSGRSADVLVSQYTSPIGVTDAAITGDHGAIPVTGDYVVDLKRDGAVIATGQPNADGSFSFPLLAPLSPGDRVKVHWHPKDILPPAVAKQEYIYWGESGGNAAGVFRTLSDGSGEIAIKPSTGDFVNQSVPSPDGGKLALWVGGTTSKFLISDPAGGKAQDVLPAGYRISTAYVWSPDSKRIAFSGQTTEKWPFPHVMNADGTGVTPVMPMGARQINVRDWGPQGILVTDFDATTTAQVLRRVDPDTTTVTTLVPNTLSLIDAKYSPDYNQIIARGSYTTTASSPTKLYIMNADGANLREFVLAKDMAVSAVDWMPDGAHLLISGYEKNVYATYELWAVNVADGTLTKLPYQPMTTSGYASSLHVGRMVTGQ